LTCRVYFKGGEEEEKRKERNGKKNEEKQKRSTIHSKAPTVATRS
jgi:hypothetical protein